MEMQIDKLMSMINELTNEMSKKINEDEFDFNDLATKRLQLLKELFARSSEVPANQLHNYIIHLQLRDEKIVQVLSQERTQVKKSLKNLDNLQRYHE